MISKKPVVFISSTIYDFKDLRSALKWWLESNDFEVFLSETNEFYDVANKNSYDVCLEAIKQSDYFILLIGNRVGGMFDEKEKISITRQEYRQAVETATTKPFPILSFVRKEVWNLKEDRKALAKLLENDYIAELTEHQRKTITTHESKFVDDAEAIFSILDEVSKKDDMKKAVKGECDFPKDNWIFQFEGYEDIQQALAVQLKISGNLENQIIKFHLSREVFNNLKRLHERSGDHIIPLTQISDFRKILPQSMDNIVHLNQKQYSRLMFFLLFCTVPADQFSTDYIDQALKSGIFLEWDQTYSEFKETDAHKVLLLIKDCISGSKKS